LCGDNDRFTNHSYTPNRHCIIEEQTGEVIEIAACDIKKGEELTNDYREIDANFDSYADELR
jgi:SET domain-containing protein